MRRRRRHIKGYTKMRERSTASICKEVEEKGIFDDVLYGGPKGQRGVFVTVKRKGRRVYLEATLRREGWPSSQYGYNASQDNPTRITFLSISKGSRHFGFYDPKELIRPPRHKFEKDAEKDPELKEFLEDILKNFNEI